MTDYHRLRDLLRQKFKPASPADERQTLQSLEQSVLYQTLQAELQKDGVTTTYAKTDVTHADDWENEELWRIIMQGTAIWKGRPVQAYFGAILNRAGLKEAAFQLLDGIHLLRYYEVEDGRMYSTDCGPGHIVLDLDDML
jgi:hypothetical protein